MKVQYDKVWFTSDLHFWHKNICKYSVFLKTKRTIEKRLISVFNWFSLGWGGRIRQCAKHICRVDCGARRGPDYTSGFATTMLSADEVC